MKHILIFVFVSLSFAQVTFTKGQYAQQATNCAGCKIAGGNWCQTPQSTSTPINGINSQGCYTYAQQAQPITGIKSTECSTFANTPAQCSGENIGFLSPKSCQSLNLVLGNNNAETTTTITLQGVESICYFTAGSTSYNFSTEVQIVAPKSTKANQPSWSYSYDFSPTWQSTSFGVVLGAEGQVNIPPNKVVNIFIWNQGINILTGAFTKGLDPITFKIFIAKWATLVQLIMLIYMCLI